MKVIIYILLYFVLTVGYYLLFSTIGMLFGFSYLECICDEMWATIYFLFIHWWMLIISLREYYVKYIKTLDLD